MSTKGVPGEGIVKITLQGELLELKPSMEAAMAVCRNGGFDSPNEFDSTVTKRLVSYDLPTMAWLIRRGLGVGDSALPALEEMIWKEGLNDVVRMLAPYLGSLRNGGKVLQPKTEGGEAGAGDNPPGAG